MPLVKTLVIGIAVLVLVFCGVGMVLPRHSHAERAIDIDAPRTTVSTIVGGFKMFPKWSPWADQDPNAKYTVEGPEFGVGAKQSWSGDPKTVGSGSQEIVEIDPGESVTWRLDFGDQGLATAKMTFVPEGRGTRVTWGLDTDNGAGPVGRWFGLLLDRWVGPDYEKGLANLKRLAESLPKADFGELSVEVVDAAPVTVAYIPSESSKDAAQIGEAIGVAYAKVLAFMKANGLGQAAPPITINVRWDDAGYGFEAAIPVDKAPEKEVPDNSPVKLKKTYGGKALKIVHRGPYGGLPPSYAKLEAFIAARGYECAGPSWDEYVGDPGNTPEAELTTNIYQPVK